MRSIQLSRSLLFGSFFILLIGAVFWPLSGCTKAVRSDHLPCTTQAGVPCTGGSWGSTTSTPVQSSWTATPHLWRYHSGKELVGYMLLGHPKHRMLSALQHAMFASLNELGTPKMLLASGVMYGQHTYGSHANQHYKRRIALWNNVAERLKQQGHLKLYDTSASIHHALKKKIKLDIERFYQSSSLRTILYYRWNPKWGPFILPHYSISALPAPLSFRLSKQALSPARALSYGQLFYRQKYRHSVPLFDSLLKTNYTHNKKVEEWLTTARLRCKYMWYNLFGWNKKTIKLNNLHIYNNKKDKLSQTLRREYCTAKRLESFRIKPSVVRLLRVQRQRLIQMDIDFKEYLAYHNSGFKRLLKIPSVSTSVAIDGVLRGHVLHYLEHVQFKKKKRDPNAMFAAWVRKQRAYVWAHIHRRSQQDGKYFTTRSSELAGIFRHSNIVFRSEQQGDDYLIEPRALLSHSFGLVLDRTRGVIEVLTHKQPYPFVGTRGLHAFPEKKKRPSSLRQVFEQHSSKGVTLIRASEALPPTSAPSIPPRSFLLQDGYTWIRLEHTIVAIPTTGLPTEKQKRLSPQQQRSIVQTIERAMSRYDGVPVRVEVSALTEATPHVQIFFPGQKKSKKQ